MNSTLDLQSSIDYRSGSAVITCTLRNTGPETVFVVSGGRMPYLLKLEAGKYRVLQGLHASDPLVNYYMVEIPATVELKPDGQLDFSLALDPPRLTDHYSRGGQPENVQFPASIQFAVGILPEAIDPKTPHLYSAQALLDQQTLIEGPVLEWTH